jgi:predicted LPLAT superfamily acyltransferase
VCRALAEIGEQVTMNVLVHTKHAEQFNRLLGEAGATHLRLIQVSELDPVIMLQLTNAWSAASGWRLPATACRCMAGAASPWISRPAGAFPQGPWLLAGLLKCPVNLLMCLKQPDGRYRLTLEPFRRQRQWTRAEREQVIHQWTARYAERLAHYCLQAPHQWFNFYPFWKTDDDANP